MGHDIEALLDGNDAIGVADAIRQGDVSATEVLEACLARIDERNPTLNAVVNRCDDVARAAVAAGVPDAPFAGVPFVVKELGTPVVGLPDSGGSRLYADVVAAADCELVARYRRAGLLIVGTTNTPELGKNPSTEPLLYGPTRNPWRLSHSPGGSSGGTAAAVAAGLVPLGHGNDGGGSIRIPASACGLVGLKPSRGRITARPKRSLLSYPLGINHVLTRSVRDTAAMLDCTAGAGIGDPYVIGAPARPWLDEVGADPGRLRIAIDVATPAGDPIHPDCASVVGDVAMLLDRLGHEVVSARPSFPVDAISTAMRVFMATSLVVDVDDRLTALGRELRDDDLEAMTHAIYRQGVALSGADVTRAHRELERAAQTVGAFFVDHDLLLTATLAKPTPPLGLLDTSDLKAMGTHAAAYSAMTGVYNVTGQPAISLPMGRDADGLPLGVQLVAAFGREDLLVRIASQLEQARPWPISPVWPAVPA
jgi:amidase